MVETYTAFIYDYIKSQEISAPIYSSRIAEAMAKYYGLASSAAAAATAVAIKRIVDRKSCPDLRFYQKGIYYRTSNTPFGESGICKEQLIADKYLLPDIGYETGLMVLHQMGLTSQVPRERVLATNAAKNGTRLDKKLGVTIRPAKTTITAENKEYLRILDLLSLMENTPVDVPCPYIILNQHVQKAGMHYDVLLAYADRYYSRLTVLQIARMASKSKPNI